MKATIPLAEGVAVDVEGDANEIAALLRAITEHFVNGAPRAEPKAPRAPRTPRTPRKVARSPRKRRAPEAVAAPSPVDEAPSLAEPPPTKAVGACKQCGNHTRSQAHADACLGGVRSTGGPRRTVRRGASHGGMSLGGDIDGPDYSDHGDLFDLPPLVFDGPDGERVVKDPKLAGVVHAHTFKLPAANDHEETLGRCSCGATRRFRN